MQKVYKLMNDNPIARWAVLILVASMAGNGTANGAKLSYKIGASVRCVMDKATKE